MKIIFTCHTEYDLKNKKVGQSFYHISLLLEFIESLKIPVTFCLMTGGMVGDNLLRFIKKENIQIPANCEKSIHYHEEKSDERKLIDYFKLFQENLGTNPTSIVFGKWVINKEHFPFFKKMGIRVDGSGTGKGLKEKFIIKAPFYLDNILEIPVVCDEENPANPFTRLSNFFLIRKIIKKYYQKNLVLHIGFHSYDFFRFNRKPKIRLIKKLIFKNILKLARKYKLEIINLSEIKVADFQNLDYIKMPFFSKIFRCFNH